MNRVVFWLLMLMFVTVGRSYATNSLNPAILWDTSRPMGLFHVDNDVKSLVDLNVRQTRREPVLWGTIEPVKGVYDFTSLDAYVLSIQNSNSEIAVITLRTINPWGGNLTAQAGNGVRNFRNLKSGFPFDMSA